VETLTGQLRYYPEADEIDGTTYWWLWLDLAGASEPERIVQVLCPPDFEPINDGPLCMGPGRVMVVEGEWVERTASKRRQRDQPRFLRARSARAEANDRPGAY
jgi:hypothetical protein